MKNLESFEREEEELTENNRNPSLLGDVRQLTRARPESSKLIMSSLELTDLKRIVRKIWKKLQEKHKTKASTGEESEKYKDSEMKDVFQLLWVVEFRVLEQEENDLAKNLRKVCTPYGDERESKLNESSEILFSMGRLYVKKAEVTTGMEQKLNFIKAAALLHGARFRFEMHLRDKVKAKDVYNTLEQVESDLLISCKGILPEAQTLIRISRNVKMTFEFIRRIEKSNLEWLEIIPENIPEADAHMKQRKKICQIIWMMEKNTINFEDQMSYVAQKCLDILGKPPCQFAIAGLGSLARREITLYSDFEHVIILEEGVQDLPEYESIKEYFRWFAVVFEIIIIGLGETIISSIGVKSINDLYASEKKNNWFYDVFTPSGVSIDGMMPHACKTPLGRQELTKKKKHIVELIQPVSKMSSLLTSVEDLKNGYYLKDVLRQSCFVFGCEALFSNFKRQALNVLSSENDKDGLDSGPKLTISNVHDPEKGVVITFGPHEIDSKSSYYRPLSALFSYLGRIKNFCKLPSFDIILRFVQKEFQHRMLWAFAVACELRMKICAHAGGNRLRVGDQQFSRFVGKKCLQNCLRQIYRISSTLGPSQLTVQVSCTGRQSTPSPDHDYQINRELYTLMKTGCYKEIREILRRRIEELENICIDDVEDDQWQYAHKSMLAHCCFRAGENSQKGDKTKLFQETKKLIKSIEGTQFEKDCWVISFHIYCSEGRYHAAFDTVEKLLEREGDSIFNTIGISSIEFGRVIALKFSCPSSAVDFCNKALKKYKGFHSQVAFKYGKALAMTNPGMKLCAKWAMSNGEWAMGSKELRDLAEDGRKEFCDLAVLVQCGIRDMSKNQVLQFFDMIFQVQMFYNWWKDALATIDFGEIIQKSKYPDKYSSSKASSILCAGSAAKYLLISMLKKNFTTKYELFRKGFQSFNFFVCEGSFCYHLNVVALWILLHIDVETSLLLKYSRELKPAGLDNFENRSNVMSQLILLLGFYRNKIRYGKILDVADDLIAVLEKFCSFQHHPLFTNAVCAIGAAFLDACAHVRHKISREDSLGMLDSKLHQILKKVRLNLILASESLDRKQYRDAILHWCHSDFKECIKSFWKIINSKKADFSVWARSVKMLYHSLLVHSGMQYICISDKHPLRVVAVTWPFLRQYAKIC